MKNLLIKKAEENLCTEIGFVKARIYEEISQNLKNRGVVSFCEADYEKRINPFLLMEDAKTIVVCLFSYNTESKGCISSYAHGMDYHKVLPEKLTKIANPLIEKGYRAKVFTDTSPLPERYLAYLAGLGFFGKNNMLINEKLGSKFFVGFIITDCEIEEDYPLNAKCMGCNKCIEACPGGALGEGYSFDEKKCVSFISQKKGELSKEEETLIAKSGYIWGCDICADVCPHNEKIKITQIPEFSEDLMMDVDIEDISNRKFMKDYKDRAFSWRGKDVLIRNKNILKIYNNE